MIEDLNERPELLSLVGMGIRREPEIPERLIQVFLSENLELLGLGALILIDLEYPVTSGRIDILARSCAGVIYPIEVKRGIATRDAVGQLQSYIGDLITSDPKQKIEGVLVAASLDLAARSALVATPTINFWSYRTAFNFERASVERPRSAPQPEVPKAPPPETLFLPPAPVPTVTRSDRFSLPPKTPQTEIRYCLYCNANTKVASYPNSTSKCTKCSNWL